MHHPYKVSIKPGQPQSSLSKLWTKGAVWIAFIAIAVLYFFGLGASSVIPFGPPMSFASVLRQVTLLDFPNREASWPFHVAVLAVSLAALLVHTFSRSHRVRLALPLLCLITPLFSMAGGIKGVAQWLLAMPAAPFFTVTALAGLQDGEFYAEGFLVFTAVGWWMILWSVLLFRELRFPRHEAHAPKSPID